MARPTTSCSLKADLKTFPKAEGDRIGDYVLDANDSFAMTGRLKSGALATSSPPATRPAMLNDLSLALHGTRGALRVETDGTESNCPPASARTSTRAAGKSSKAAGQAQRAAFRRCAVSGVNGDPSFRRAAEIQS